MGNTPTASILQDVDFLPGDLVRIVDDKMQSEKMYLVNSVATEQDAQQTRRAVVVEECDTHTVVGVYKPDQLFLVNNEQNKRRRIEYGLLNHYVQVCKSRKIVPNDTILTLYSEHIKQGMYVHMFEILFFC